MIKAVINNNVFLGIDARNVEKLTSGEPVLVKGKDIKSDKDIFIVYGDTIEELVDKYFPGLDLLPPDERGEG